MEYDVMVVGARVAGAATALLLARQGLRVLAVDRARFGSDTISSHQVQVPGVALLRDWGVLDAVMAGTPATSRVTFDAGAAVLRGSYPPYRGVDTMLSPRRTLLDRVLVEAAATAGAEMLDGTIVDELLTAPDGQVTGVRLTPKGGSARQVRARLVIGADGKHSFVARTVGAREYRTRPARSAACYGYFAELAERTSGSRAELPTAGGEIFSRPDRLVGVWPTTGGLSIVYLAVPATAFPRLHADLDRGFRETVAGVGDLGERLREARQVEHLRATTDLPNTLRKPYGPGWLLVGDAGLVMDPITGQGIGNALQDAQAACAAIVAGLGGSQPLATALTSFHHARDRARRPMYDLTVGLAAFRPDPSGEILFPAIAADPDRVSRFLAVLAGTVPADQFFSPGNLRAMVGTRGLLRMAAARLGA